MPPAFCYSYCCLVVELLSAINCTCFCHCTLMCNCQCSCCRPFLLPIVDRCPQAVWSLDTTCLCCFCRFLVVALLSAAACFCHHTPLCNHQSSCCQPLLITIGNNFHQVVLTPGATRPLLHLSLVGCCVVVHCLLLSLLAIVRLSILLLPAAFATNC